MSRFPFYAFIGSNILPVFCKVNDFFVPVNYSVSIQNIIQTFLSSFLSLNPSVQFLICIFLNQFFLLFFLHCLMSISLVTFPLSVILLSRVCLFSLFIPFLLFIFLFRPSLVLCSLDLYTLISYLGFVEFNKITE